MADTFISPYTDQVKAYQDKIISETARYAAAGLSFQNDAPGAYSALLKNIKYYSTGGTGYQDAYRDWQFQEAEKIAPSLGITANQLLTNPQLATDPVALAQYRGIDPNIQRYYSQGGVNGNWQSGDQTGYQDVYRDWQLNQAAQIAPSLGITAAQLVTNPQLATDPIALAQYKAIDPNIQAVTSPQSVPSVQPQQQPAQQTLGTVVAPTPTTSPVTSPQNVTTTSSYSGPSIVDYLNSVGKPSDFASRTTLATQMGIQNYTGTAEQNTQLLNMLRGGSTMPQPVQQPAQTQQQTTQVAPVTASPVTPPQTAPQTTQPTAAGGYTGLSIVDYLASIGQPSDFGSRSKLAAQYGISNYSGTAEQNTQLLGALRNGQQKIPSTPSAPNTQTLGTATETAGSTATPTTTSFMDSGNPFAEILKQNNITLPSTTQSPVTSFADLYQQLYEKAGLADIKTQFTDIQKQYSDLQDKKNEEIQNINNDPWLTEGVRIQRVNRINTKYEGKEQTLTDQLKLYQGLYDSGRQDVQYIATQSLSLSEHQATLDQDQLFKAIDIAEKQAEAQINLAKSSSATTRGTSGGDTFLPPTATNIKTGLFGLTEAQARDVFSENNPPDWFREKIESGLNMSLTATALQNEWNKYRAAKTGSGSTGITGTTSSTSPLQYDSF